MTVIPFQRFLDEQRESVWRFLVASVGRDAADDCFQETFLAAMRAYPPHRADNLRGWVLTIAHNKAMDHHRRRVRHAVPVADLPEVAVWDGEPGGGDEVWERVRSLPDKQRAAVTLRYAADLSHREVAAAMGTSEEAARRSAHEGLKRLRLELTA